MLNTYWEMSTTEAIKLAHFYIQLGSTGHGLREILEERLVPLDINATYARRGYMLHMAVKADNVNALEVLLDQPTLDVNRLQNRTSAFGLAMQLGHTKLLRLFLRHPHINVMQVVNEKTGNTALHQFIQYVPPLRRWWPKENREMLEYMLAHPSVSGLDVRNKEGYSPFGLALLLHENYDRDALCQLLVQHPAQPPKLGMRWFVPPPLSRRHHTYYHAAVRCGPPILYVLLAKHAQPLHRNTRKQTAAMLAQETESVSYALLAKYEKWALFMAGVHDPSNLWHYLPLELVPMIESYVLQA